MVKINFIVLFFIFLSPIVCAQRVVVSDSVVFSVMKDDECEDVRRLQEKKLKILLIRRGGFPYKGSWAMPGGFCRKGEDVIDSARREQDNQVR